VIPTSFVNPHISRVEAERLKVSYEDIRGVPVIKSANIQRVISWYQPTSEVAVSVLDVFHALMRAPEGFEALMPPKSCNGPDYRRIRLRQLAQYHEISVHMEELPDRSILVRLAGIKPPASSPVRLLSPIEASRHRLAIKQDSISPFRPLPPDVVPGGYQDYEPYGVYIAALLTAHGNDLGAAVVYPYHELRSKGYQQSRLHHEAGRVGIRVSLKQLDRWNVLVTFRDRQMIIDVADYEKDESTGITVLPDEEASMEEL
jgi:hypothetical protein